MEKAVDFFEIEYYNQSAPPYTLQIAPPNTLQTAPLKESGFANNVKHYFSVFFFLKDSPLRSKRWALPANLSIIASATVDSPIYSCHLSTGS